MTPLQQVRLLVADNTPGLYIISDPEIEFLLEKNSASIKKASLEAARIILFNLSMRGDSTVDIFSIRGSKAAQSYKEALQLYLKDPNLNGLLDNLTPYAGGISNSDMQANNTSDVNYVKPPVVYTDITTLVF